MSTKNFLSLKALFLSFVFLSGCDGDDKARYRPPSAAPDTPGINKKLGEVPAPINQQAWESRMRENFTAEQSPQ
ncbi:MAG: hypothetical protein WBK55_00795 [Alphaproteobacteria bacterium]